MQKLKDRYLNTVLPLNRGPRPRAGYSLWQRYWASLTGVPLAPRSTGTLPYLSVPAAHEPERTPARRPPVPRSEKKASLGAAPAPPSRRAPQLAGRRGPALELYGRGKILRFVTDALDRGGNRDTPPVMLLIGPRGSGKTTLTRSLEARYRDRVPVCAIDLSLQPDATPAAVLWLIARAFSGRIAGRGKLRFPLVRLGLIAVSLDPQSASSPAEQLQARLDRGPLPGQALTTLITQARTLLPPAQWAIAETATVSDWIAGSYSRRRLNDHLAWYAAQPELADDGSRTGPLLVLYRKCHDAVAHPDPNARREAGHAVWRVLTMALLQDLRNDFGRTGLTSGRRTTNCLLLLDNADTEAGRNLLETLAECREALPATPDPLLVVATQGTGQPLHPSVPEPIPAHDYLLSHANWLDAARTPGSPPSLFYPVLLTDLSEDEVRSEIKTRVLGMTWLDADYVYALTGGHPGAVGYLARRLADVTEPFDPRDLLTPDAEDDLLTMLSPAKLNDRQLRAMSVFAATAHPELEAVASVFRRLGLAHVNEMDIRDRLIDLMWATSPPGTQRRPGADGLDLRPLPRLLLQRWLARDRTAWEEVHNGYLAYYRSQGTRERTAERYHLLALTTSIGNGASGNGNIRTIAAQFDSELDRQDTAAWVASLAVVTTAPNRLLRADEDRAAVGEEPHFKGDPEDVVKRLADVSLPSERERAMARLIVAGWLLNDRSFDPSRRLARLLADEYHRLARLTEGDSGVFYRGAGHFLEIARE